MDTSGACFWVVHETLPHIDVVFDRFHVSALMNQAIDQEPVGVSIRRG